MARGVGGRFERLWLASMEARASREKLATIDLRPGDEELRQQIDAAVEALRVVEVGLVQAFRREYPRTRQARHQARRQSALTKWQRFRLWKSPEVRFARSETLASRSDL
jgi:hypothetical protein